MKYKKGDKVQIRSDLVIGKTYGKEEWCTSMDHLRGKTVTIAKVGAYYYNIEEYSYAYSDEMIEGLAEEQSDRLENNLIYHSEDTNGDFWMIGRVLDSSIENLHSSQLNCKALIINSNKEFRTCNWCYKSSSRNYRLANVDETKWFEACEKANKFIPKEEALKEQSKFEVGKWYTNGKKEYTKLHHVHRDELLYGTDFIYSGSYKLGGGDSWYGTVKDYYLLTDLSEIQQYLPEGHVDKVKVDVIPEYVECISTSYGGSFTRGTIYKVKGKSYGDYLIELDNKGSADNGWGISNFKSSTKSLYDEQNKPKQTCSGIDKDWLLAEAKRRYPKGTIFISTEYGGQKTSTGEFYLEDTSIHTGGNYCYSNGKWAEIISKPEEKTLRNGWKVGNRVKLIDTPFSDFGMDDIGTIEEVFDSRTFSCRHSKTNKVVKGCCIEFWSLVESSFKLESKSSELTSLPEKWWMQVNNEKEWLAFITNYTSEKCHLDFKPHFPYYTSNIDSYDGWTYNGINCYNTRIGAVEITFDQFKKWVLKDSSSVVDIKYLTIDEIKRKYPLNPKDIERLSGIVKHPLIKESNTVKIELSKPKKKVRQPLVIK